jgi:hypothetical protein
MQYFDTLPKIIYTNQSGISRVMTNLLARASVIPDVLKNPLVYYKYDIQDGDTPETIAHKYYGDSYRYWIVLFANQMLDPQWSWPLNTNDFNAYIADKYKNTDPYNTVKSYQKIITQFDYSTNTTSSTTIVVDEDTYNAIVPQTNYFTLPTGQVSISVDKNILTVYDDEVNQNEAKRNINILNVLYVDQLESEFKKLMSV